MSYILAKHQDISENDLESFYECLNNKNFKAEEDKCIQDETCKDQIESIM